MLPEDIFEGWQPSRIRAMLNTLSWKSLRRPSQVPPEGDWLTWLILAGRGWGKTRTGAEWVHDHAHLYERFHLIGRTASDVRDTMVEGESGLIVTARPDNPCRYMPTKRKVVWENGASALLFSADEPDQLRGPQCFAAWLDEVAAWRFPDAYDMHTLGLRLGDHPRQVITTTPRPTRIIRELVKDTRTVVTRGSTYENRDNMAPAFFETITRRYEGTRLGRQELYAEILDDLPGALWARELFRYKEPPKQGEDYDFIRVVVAVDPAASSNENSDETGIVVVGIAADGLVYVLDDLSMRGSPDSWARRAVYAYSEWMADRIVAESNMGGDMVESVIRNVAPDVPVRLVRATRGKRVRAEPISSLYEQGRVFHVKHFPDLEDQMCNYVPDQAGDGSPDRMDALVWGITELKPERQEMSGQFAGIA